MQGCKRHAPNDGELIVRAELSVTFVEQNLKLGRPGGFMVSSRGRSPRSSTWFCLAAVLLASPAFAQGPPFDSLALAQGRPGAQPSPQSAIGFQGGVSIDPEQGFVGVFWQSPPIGGRFHIRPGIDGGFGGDLRVATINIDFLALFPIGSSGWNFVQGGGPVIAITRIPALDASDTSAGGSYIIGFAHDDGFFTEFRIGGGSTPGLKIGGGYQLKF